MQVSGRFQVFRYQEKNEGVGGCEGDENTSLQVKEEIGRVRPTIRNSLSLDSQQSGARSWDEYLTNNLIGILEPGDPGKKLLVKSLTILTLEPYLLVVLLTLSKAPLKVP